MEKILNSEKKFYQMIFWNNDENQYEWDLLKLSVDEISGGINEISDHITCFSESKMSFDCDNRRIIAAGTFREKWFF